MHLIRYKKFMHSKVFLLLLVTLIWLVADNLLEFVFPTYLEGIGKSYLEIGILLSLASVSGMLIDLPLGSLSDRASRKKIMISGLVLSIVAGILIFAFEGNLILVFAFLFWGLAYQVWKVPRDAQFAALTTKSKRAEFYGFDSEVKYIGQTLGPLIGGFVLLYAGFAGILSFYSILLVLAVFALLVCMKETNRRPIMGAISSSARLKSLMSELKELKLFGAFGMFLLYFSLLFVAWEQILWTLQPLFYGPDVLNIPPSLGGLLLAFFSLPGILLSYPAGKLADRIGKKTVLFAGLAVTGIFLILFSMSHNLFFIFLFALLISVGWVISLPALSGLIIDISYRHKKGKIAGIWDFFMDIGFVAGPILGGLIAELYGIRYTFMIIGIVFLASMLLLLFVKQQNLNTNR